MPIPLPRSFIPTKGPNHRFALYPPGLCPTGDQTRTGIRGQILDVPGVSGRGHTTSIMGIRVAGKSLSWEILFRSLAFLAT